MNIAATNVLDSLFLAGVLRERCPDTRLLIDEPNLLFVKAAQSEPLDGILALSSYPLFSGSRLWSLGKTGGAHPIHESSGAEAVYNAISSFLLERSSLANLNDYAWDDNHHPQTWLLEVSRQGFAPIKLLANDDRSWYYNDPVDTTASFRVRGPSMLWFLITSALGIVSFTLCAWIGRLHRNRLILTWSVVAPDGNHIADAYRLMFLFFALLILAAAQAILYIPLLSAAPPPSIASFFRYRFFHLLAIAGIVLPFTFSIWLLKPIFAKPRVRPARYVYAALGLVFALFIPALWYVCCTHPDGRAGLFLGMRALEMHASTSPVLPILFLLAALFVFALGHLVRFHFLISQRPRMFTAAVDRFSKGKLRSCRRAMNRILASPMDAKPRRQAVLALALIGAFCVADLVFGAHIRLSSNEGRLYDTITLSLLALVLAAIGLTAAQVKRCWTALQQILVRLHALPLLGYFTQIQDKGKSGPIWTRRFNLQSLDIPTKSIIILHNLRVVPGTDSSVSAHLCSNEVTTWFDNYREALGSLISARKTFVDGDITKEQSMDRYVVRKEFGRLRYLGAMISQHLNGYINIPEWTKSILPWSAPAAAEAAKAGKKCANDKEQHPSDFAQIFVALQYSMFINFGVRQIQNLLLLVSVGFTLLVIALNVCAFEAPHLINRFLFAGFFVLGYIIWQILSQMERDPILSRLSGTTEGALSRDFYMKVIGYAALPLVSLLSSQFPAIGHVLTSWVEPSLEAFK